MHPEIKNKEEMMQDNIDFGTMNIPRLFRKMFIPTLLGMVLAATITIADGIFVGRGVGSDALAAVNITAQNKSRLHQYYPGTFRFSLPHATVIRRSHDIQNRRRLSVGKLGSPVASGIGIHELDRPLSGIQHAVKCGIICYPTGRLTDVRHAVQCYPGLN